MEPSLWGILKVCLLGCIAYTQCRLDWNSRGSKETCISWGGSMSLTGRGNFLWGIRVWDQIQVSAKVDQYQRWACRGDDVALCQITLYTCCFGLLRCRAPSEFRGWRLPRVRPCTHSPWRILPATLATTHCWHVYRSTSNTSYTSTSKASVYPVLIFYS